jgi:chemotaxis response regulator CheB
MRSLVIDDEADARARLIRLLGAHPEVAVIGEAQDGLEAIEKIEELRPDLLFLDIEMPGLKGFEAIPSAIEIPLVIFTTGYDQHALAAFGGQRARLSPQAHRTGAVVVCCRTLEQTLLSFRGKRKGAREHSARDRRGTEDAPQNRLPEKRTRPARAFGTNPLVPGAGWHRACEDSERLVLGELPACRT